MKTWILAGGVSAVSCLGLVATASAEQGYKKLSQADCQTLWKQADASGSGSLSMAQSQAYISDFKSVDANADGKLSSSEFLQGCQDGHVKGSASTGAGAGSSGSDPSGSSSSGSGSSDMSR